jgi:hypothetical protein
MFILKLTVMSLRIRGGNQRSPPLTICQEEEMRQVDI